MIYFIAGAIGLVSGVFSGLFGVGGGVIMIPAMVYLMHLPVKTAIGTSLAVIVPTAIAGSIKHIQVGGVDFKVVLMLAPLAMVGGLGGAWLASQVPAETLKRVFGGFHRLCRPPYGVGKIGRRSIIHSQSYSTCHKKEHP